VDFRHLLSGRPMQWTPILLADSAKFRSLVTSGAAAFDNGINVTGTSYMGGPVRLTRDVFMINKDMVSALAFLAWDTTGTDAVYNLSNVGTLTTAGTATFNKLKINSVGVSLDSAKFVVDTLYIYSGTKIIKARP
jgi:hypothetical protein